MRQFLAADLGHVGKSIFQSYVSVFWQIYAYTINYVCL